LKSLGIDTILDPTVLGLGRCVPRIQKIAARTDLRIIVATGVYTYNEDHAKPSVKNISFRVTRNARSKLSIGLR
jgi:predicted metal-dependent phosphotriesterase family hydrolase